MSAETAIELTREPSLPAAASYGGADGRNGALSAAAGVSEEEMLHSCRQDAADLRRYASLLLGDPETAEDVLQESLLKLLTAVRTGCRIRNRRAWLFRVTHNACLERLRQQRHFVGVERLREARRAASNPETTYHRRRLAGQLIRRLTPRELACVRLRAEGFSYAEIAEALNIRSGTVGALLNRATARCRSALSAAPASGNGPASSE